MPKNIRTLPNKQDHNWVVRRDDAARVSGIFDTQREANYFARGIAQRDHLEHSIHGRDGKIREKNSYGNDPAKSKG